MKRIAILLISALAVLAVFACSKEKQNERMHEMVRNKEHDPLLFGWWNSLNKEDHFIIYETDPFKKKFALIENGILTEYNNGWYWYTEDNIIYSFREATIKTGIFDSKTPYRISEDGQYLLTKGSDGSFEPSYKRVDKPE